jgi:hypothetical protein
MQDIHSPQPEGMQRVQITGLPGAGKTTGIETFLSLHRDLKISLLDIRNFDRPKAIVKFTNAIKSTTGKLIAESVVGALQTDTAVIRLAPDIQQVYRQHQNRGECFLDEDYLSIMQEHMIPAHYIVTNSDELSDLLTRLIV